MEPVLNPYLTFNGNAGEAMRFYHSVIGGTLDMQTFKDAKMAKTKEEDRIVHALLKAEGIVLMASDGQMNMQVEFGDNVNMSISGSDPKRLGGIFEGLAKGGRVDMPLAKQFWGDTFGMLTDKFGIHWMVNIEAAPQT